MEFKAVFTTGMNSNTSPFDHFNPGHGTDYVDAIRELALMPELPLDLIQVNDTCSMLTGKTHYPITTDVEDHIKQVMEFDTAQKVKVIVPAGFLGQYVKMTVDIRYEDLDWAEHRADLAFIEKFPQPKKGFPFPIKRVAWNIMRALVGVRAKRIYRRFPDDRHIVKITNGWEVDEEQLYFDWVEAGFPLYWGISEEVHLKHKDERAKLVAQLKDEKEKAKAEAEEAKKAEKRELLTHISEDIESLGKRLKSVL